MFHISTQFHLWLYGYVICVRASPLQHCRRRKLDNCLVTASWQARLGPRHGHPWPNLKSKRSNEVSWLWLCIGVDCPFHLNFKVLTPNWPLYELESYFLLSKWNAQKYFIYKKVSFTCMKKRKMKENFQLVLKDPIWVGGPPSTPCGYNEVLSSICNSNQIANACEAIWDSLFFSFWKKWGVT